MPDASTGAMIVKDTLPHTINVVVHVTFGTLALGLGLIQLLRSKGGCEHTRRGLWFLGTVAGIVTTAAVGSLVFNVRAFLVVITMLVAYESYSGWRALRIRYTGPARQDALASLSALAAAVAFILYIQTVQFPWAPAVIYSTLGALAGVASYDLIRFTFPKRWFETLWLYEHLVKMIGAFSGVVSAFAGTVLVAWQPYSQLVPPVVLTAVALGYIVTLRRTRGTDGDRRVRAAAELI